MTLLYIIGVFAAIWVYRDAQKFGHGKNSALLWAIGTVVFFLVFFPLYLLLGRKAQIKREKRIDQHTIEAEAAFGDVAAQDCPMCAKKVQEEFNVCPYCGYTLKPTCGNCGKALSRECQVCPSCRAKAPEK